MHAGGGKWGYRGNFPYETCKKAINWDFEPNVFEEVRTGFWGK